MRKLIYLMPACVLLSCVEIKTASLPVDKPLEQYAKSETEQSVSAGENDGLIANGKYNLGNWETNAPGKWSAYGVKDTLMFDVREVGPHWEEITLNLPPTDFSKHEHLELEAKIDGIKIPVMRIDLLDDKGRMTNSKPQSLKMVPRSGYLRYHFNYSGAWYQNWPYKGEMDPTRITKIRININGGGLPYSGKIYIKGIKALKEF